MSTTPTNPIFNPFVDLTPTGKSEETLLLEGLSEEELSSLLSRLITLSTESAKDDFYVYTKLMAPVILPEGFRDGKHIELMCRELEKVEQSIVNETPIRFQEFLPPGSMKSKLLNLFVTWVLGRHPKWNILHIGHSTEFAHDNFGRQIRDVIKTPEYHSIFPDTEVRQDVRASGRWATTEGGQYYATGVGTRIAGRRAHLCICDDVVSEQTAYSKLEREKINNWYVPGLRSRLLPNGAEVIVNTRWHLEDLSGFLIKADSTSKRPWKVIRIPALLDEEASELLGLPVGSSFWPELWTTEKFEETRDSDGTTKQVWAALYMQNPVADEGGLIKTADIMVWTSENPPLLSYVLISMDTAFSTSTRADYSAITVWGIFKQTQKDYRGNEHVTSNMILLDAKRGRWAFPELCEEADRMRRIYLPDVFVIEKKASGQSLIQELRRRGFPIKEYLPDRDKLSRLHAVTPFFESHRIWFPIKKWADEVINELTTFPHTKNDDLMDSAVQAILLLRDMYALGNTGYSVDEDDEDAQNIRTPRTYWAKLASGMV